MKNSEGSRTYFSIFSQESNLPTGKDLYFDIHNATQNQNKNLPMPITYTPNLNSFCSLTSHNPSFYLTSCFHIIFLPIRMASLLPLTQCLYSIHRHHHILIPACMPLPIVFHVPGIPSTLR